MRREVRGLRETAARLALARTVAPPARMEQRLAATYQTRQLPPLAASHRQALRPASWPRRVAIAAAAASVAAAVSLGITQASTQHQLDTIRASDAEIARVVTAPDARIETRAPKRAAASPSSPPPPAGIRRQRHRDGALPAGRVYQVWVMSPVRRPLRGPDHRHPAPGFGGRPRRPHRHHRRTRRRHHPPHHHSRGGSVHLTW